MNTLKAALQSMSEEAKEATLEFMRARDEYSANASIHAKIRLLADHPNASDADVLRYARIRKEFSLQSKAYHVARGVWARKMHFLKSPAPSISDQEYIDLYGPTSGRALNAQYRVNEALKTVDPDLLEQIKRNNDSDARDRFLEKVADEEAGVVNDIVTGDRITANERDEEAQAEIKTKEFSLEFKKEKDPTGGNFEF